MSQKYIINFGVQCYPPFPPLSPPTKFTFLPPRPPFLQFISPIFLPFCFQYIPPPPSPTPPYPLPPPYPVNMSCQYVCVMLSCHYVLSYLTNLIRLSIDNIYVNKQTTNMTKDYYKLNTISIG
jgi:hypothetical protein